MLALGAFLVNALASLAPMTKCRFLTTRRNARPRGSLAEHSHTSKGAPGDLRQAAKSGLTLRASSNAPYIRRIQMAHSVIKARPRTDKRSEASPHPSPLCASLYSFLSLYLHVTPLSLCLPLRSLLPSLPLLPSSPLVLSLTPSSCCHSCVARLIACVSRAKLL